MNPLASIRPPSRRRSRRSDEPARPDGPRDVILLGGGVAAQRWYIPALQALQDANSLTIRAFVEPQETARAACARAFPQASSLTSLDAAVAPLDSLVIVATPARFHAAQTVAAFKRGWHVLCTTPFATSAHDAALMIAAAQRHERLLAVDLHPRFFPAARYLRTLCHDHLLGPALSFNIHVGRPRTPEGEAPSASGKFEAPDGVMTDLGTHVLDLLTWWLGSASIINYADDAMGGAEANASIDLTLAEGVRGTVHLSRDWPTEQAHTFVFERGIVRWNADRANSIALQLASAPAALQGELATSLSPVSSHPVTPLLATVEQAQVAQLQNLLAAIAGQEQLRSPGTEAMHSLPLIEECFARRTSLPQPWLTHNEAAHARGLSPPVALRRK